MSKFETLTKHIPELQSGKFGEWMVVRAEDSSPEKPMQFPFVVYSQAVYKFENDFFSFCENHPEYDYSSYGDTLAENNIDWGQDSMQKADVSKLNAKCIIAMIVGAFRAERFCDGALLGFLESGAILKWLLRLKELDSLEK